jgi:hypothetical protein
VWNKLSKDWKPDNLADIATEITLNCLKNWLNAQWIKGNCYKHGTIKYGQTYYYKKNLQFTAI